MVHRMNEIKKENASLFEYDDNQVINESLLIPSIYRMEMGQAY